MISGQGYQILLDFVEELPERFDRFTPEVHALFQRYFNVIHSAVSAWWEIPDPDSPGGRRPLTGTIAFGIEEKRIRDFSLSLDRLAGKRKRETETVLVLSTLLPGRKLPPTGYLDALAAGGFVDHAKLLLRVDETWLVAVDLLRTGQEGPFREDEIETLQVAARFLLQRYRLLLKNLEGVHFAQHFEAYFGQLDLGAALLDGEGRILSANDAFCEYMDFILAQGHFPHPLSLAHPERVPERFHAGQKILDFFGHKVLTAPERIRIECLIYQCHLHTQPLQYSWGHRSQYIERQYLVFLDRQEKITSPEILSALRDLTSREMSVLGLVVDGKTNEEIADAMSISIFTVKSHLQKIYAKLNISGRTELLTKLR